MTQDKPDPLFSDSQPGKLGGIDTEVITVGIDRRAPRANPDECPMCGLNQAAKRTPDELRAFFEQANNDSYGFKRSRRGNYVNPAIARDWKWFCLGVGAKEKT